MQIDVIYATVYNISIKSKKFTKGDFGIMDILEQRRRLEEDRKKQGMVLCKACGNPVNFFKRYMVDRFGNYFCDKDVDRFNELAEEGDEEWFDIFDGEDIDHNNPVMPSNNEEADDATEYHCGNVRMDPVDIKTRLDQYVIGQEDAKRILATAVYNHWKRINNKDNKVEIEKSNVLMLGPTGCGKTYIVKTLAKMLDIPLAIADSTNLTETGYVGDDVQSILTRLFNAAGGDETKAEKGIVFIDEIDKLAKKKSMAAMKDVGGESVQQALLKLMEGSIEEVSITPKKDDGSFGKLIGLKQTTTRIDTTNILFICGGAFPGIEDIIHERLSRTGENVENNVMKHVTPDDIREFGMIPEFIGRCPVVVSLEEMTIETLRRILTEPRNAIVDQYKALMKIDNLNISFNDEALAAIAKKAIARGTGARSLRSIMEEVLADVMFSGPSWARRGITDIIITDDYVNGDRQALQCRGFNTP